MKYCILTIGLFTLSVVVAGQSKRMSEKDLQPEWLAFDGREYVPLAKEDAKNVVYLRLAAGQFRGDYFSVQSANPYFLFFNGKLSGEYSGAHMFKLDSLLRVYDSPHLFISVYQKKINFRDLKTVLLSAAPAPTANLQHDLQRPATYFRDFVVLAGLIIVILFVIHVQLNPKLTFDYFSVAKMFSLREGDDVQSNARFTNSANIQFYISCSMLLAFSLLIVLYHLPESFLLPVKLRAGGFWGVIWQWIQFSAVILGALFLKGVIVFNSATLFGLKGVARIHFFNWVRLLLIIFSISAVVLFVYFILRGNSSYFYSVFLTAIIAALTAWIVVAFLKLNNRSDHTMFHLFSYICATEIIPLLITIKVLIQ